MKAAANPAPAVPSIPAQQTIIEQIAAQRSAFTLQFFSSLVGISYNAALDMANDGRLPVMRIGASIRLDPKTTADWLHEHTKA